MFHKQHGYLVSRGDRPKVDHDGGTMTNRLCTEGTDNFAKGHGE
jgi:hypothetical protein